MSLKDWADNGWLRSHQSSRSEIEGLLSIVERDLRDAVTVGVSADWRFRITESAALTLCTVLIRASGYRPEKTRKHDRTIAALPLILGAGRQNDAAFLDACRTKRNTVEYDMVGAVTEGNVHELLEFTHELRNDVLAWLKQSHPELIPKT